MKSSIFDSIIEKILSNDLSCDYLISNLKTNCSLPDTQKKSNDEVNLKIKKSKN